MLDSQRNEMQVKQFGIDLEIVSCSESKNISSVNLTSADFDNVDTGKSYTFVLQSYNDVGFSDNYSSVFIPMATSSKLNRQFCNEEYLIN